MATPTYEGTTALINDNFLPTIQADGSVTGGQVVYISGAYKAKVTDGARKDVYGVALITGADGKKITVVRRGIVRVKASGAISAGSRIASDAMGKVQAVGTTSAGSTYVQADVQGNYDKLETAFGRALTAASQDGDIIDADIYCTP